MKKTVALILSALLICTLFSGCKANKKVNVIIMNDLNSASAVHLINDAKLGKTKDDYSVTTVYTAQAVTTKITREEADIAIVPAYVAAALYNKTEGGVILLGLTSSSGISIVTKDEQINSIADLKGKQIFVSGRNTDTEFMIKYILNKNGITSDDVKVTSVADDAQLIEKMNNGQAKIAVAFEPTKTFVLNFVEGATSPISLTSEWNNLSNDAGIITGCVVVREEFLKKNKGKVKRFIKEMEGSVYMSSADKTETARLCKEYEITENNEIAKTLLKNSDLKFIKGDNMKTAFKKNINALHKIGMLVMGQKAPGEKFYYGAK